MTIYKSDYHGDFVCTCLDYPEHTLNGYCCKVPLVCDPFFGWLEEDGKTHSERMVGFTKARDADWKEERKRRGNDEN